MEVAIWRAIFGEKWLFLRIFTVFLIVCVFFLCFIVNCYNVLLYNSITCKVLFFSYNLLGLIYLV